MKGYRSTVSGNLNRSVHNSSNSSISPSQDQEKGFQPKRQPKSGKKRGGQPGHEGHDRPLYPIEMCESITEHYPAACWDCGYKLSGEDPQPYRYVRDN